MAEAREKSAQTREKIAKQGLEKLLLFQTARRRKVLRAPC